MSESSLTLSRTAKVSAALDRGFSASISLSVYNAAEACGLEHATPFLFLYGLFLRPQQKTSPTAPSNFISVAIFR